MVAPLDSVQGTHSKNGRRAEEGFDQDLSYVVAGIFVQSNSLSLTVRTCHGAHRALVDIAQKCSSHLAAIHDQKMIKSTVTSTTVTASHFVICKANVNVSGAQLINFPDNVTVIHGSIMMVQLKTLMLKPILVRYSAY